MCRDNIKFFTSAFQNGRLDKRKDGEKWTKTPICLLYLQEYGVLEKYQVRRKSALFSPIINRNEKGRCVYIEEEEHRRWRNHLFSLQNGCLKHNVTSSPCHKICWHKDCLLLMKKHYIRDIAPPLYTKHTPRYINFNTKDKANRL